MVSKLICTVCPKGCEIIILEKDGGKHEIYKNKCEKGKEYVLQEIKNPLRIFTTTVKVKGGNLSRIAVRSKEPVPKDIVVKLIKPLRKIEVTAPINKGDIIVKNILGLDIDIVASRSISSMMQVKSEN